MGNTQSDVIENDLNVNMISESEIDVRIDEGSGDLQQLSVSDRMPANLYKMRHKAQGPQPIINLNNIDESQPSDSKQSGGDGAESEIQVNVVPLSTFGHSFKGGSMDAAVSESEIDVRVVAIDSQQGGSGMHINRANLNYIMEGGADDSVLNADDLLKTIMQLGGADSESSVSTASSSYNAPQKETPKRKNKNTENSSDDDSSSDEYYDSSDSDSDSYSDEIFKSDYEVVDLKEIYENNVNKIMKKQKSKKGAIMSESEVYVMSDSSADDENVIFRGFSNPV